MSSRMKLRPSTEICADCSAPGPEWASVNRGVLICDECCSVHRSLGRHISQVKHLRHSSWSPTLLAMVRQLVANGANSIWEHSLLDPNQVKTGLRKPNQKDRVHPTKATFIKAKYQRLAFVPRLPCKDDDTITVADLSQQLHSSVRTGNLETCLRLLSLGARANYYYPARNNTPLHVAANAGQALQVELLIVHGADPSKPDKNGKTAVDYALEAGFTNIAQRLIEVQYELTDRLTYYLCGRRPDHQNGVHYLIPTMADSRLDLSDDANKAKSKLQALNHHLFEELASDVYDEIDRRECDSVPFLPVNPSFSSTRNQGRQKLALFNAREFATLIIDILNDARRREQDSNPELTQGFVETHIFPIEEDSYDHEYDEGTTTSFLEEDSVPMEHYMKVEKAYSTADARVQQLLQVNATQSHEIQKLQLLDDSDEDDHVDIADITPYEAPGSLLRNRTAQPSLRGQTDVEDANRTKKVNPYDNVRESQAEPGEESRYLNVGGMREHERMTDSPFDEQLDQEAVKLINEGDILVNQITKGYPQPSQENVVRCTEQITKKIQELLLAAQAGRHSCFIPCSSNIFSAVNDMAKLFPEDPVVESMRVSLQLMKTSAARLQVECKSAVLPGNTVDMAFLTQQVIQCAYDIAKAAKQLVTTFSVE
ncbi:ARF GTPase-activating protein GIT2 [Acropora cervicornis]|uniref:ARF GTPase-activating protein GIT2 n=1 Tax=Acropora cervicornis TaxID=6130 RepID=A0AAD9QJ21_ACRCE|nr:ARF GTPase-activating protein GIT2 [Acropora cervicornis]